MENFFPAVIPVTDCCHELLPIQFVIDPGEDFVWGRDDLNEAVIQKLTITTHDKIGLLNEYLDVVQVGEVWLAWTPHHHPQQVAF